MRSKSLSLGIIPHPVFQLLLMIPDPATIARRRHFATMLLRAFVLAFALFFLGSRTTRRAASTPRNAESRG